jgi:DNA-binding PadR family transcriptional regulator
MSRGREFYGYEIHRELLSKGFKVEIGRFYRVLARMLKEELLESRWEKSQLGPRKRMYRLSRKGREELDRALLLAIRIVHDFYEEYLLTLPHKFNPLNQVCLFLTRGLKGKRNIVCVASKYSSMVEKLVQTLHGDVSQGRTYLVVPDSMGVNSNLHGPLLLNGAYDNIPLKEGYVDLLVVANLPRKKLKTALSEWRRVLTQTGRLAIVTPTALVRKYQDPLAMGEFLEKHENEPAGRIEHVDKQCINALLKKLFHTVEERQIVHMTIFSASQPRHT